MARPNEFTEDTKRKALSRQHFKCGSCGTKIHRLGNAGRSQHKYAMYGLILHETSKAANVNSNSYKSKHCV